MYVNTYGRFELDMNRRLELDARVPGAGCSCGFGEAVRGGVGELHALTPRGKQTHPLLGSTVDQQAFAGSLRCSVCSYPASRSSSWSFFPVQVTVFGLGPALSPGCCGSAGSTVSTSVVLALVGGVVIRVG
ncbi:hypothetical protein G3I60_04375 [Streptomyces sp. SID13666]|uniref:hypothetical protein n=1 Tax=unclassified Streptomyces TaxID=2593676 RepID=UPI0013BF21CB|nr:MULTISPECIES: hypothetical protein [unclassified Streptomyces]NEA53417.1 hypothetical protein [Streptomyces sp. SID13666]NEA69258.1 hypothetical protein [Streptomyces sp. SID13588]